MGHLNLIAELPATHQSVLGIDAQDLADGRGAVSKYGEILGDALAHQAQHQGLGHQQRDRCGEQAIADRPIEPAGLYQPRRAFLDVGPAGPSRFLGRQRKPQHLPALRGR